MAGSCYSSAVVERKGHGSSVSLLKTCSGQRQHPSVPSHSLRLRPSIQRPAKKIRFTSYIHPGSAKRHAKPTRPRARDVVAADVPGDLATTAHERHSVRGVATGGPMVLGLRAPVHPCHRVRTGTASDHGANRSRLMASGPSREMPEGVGSEGHQTWPLHRAPAGGTRRRVQTKSGRQAGGRAQRRTYGVDRPTPSRLTPAGWPTHPPIHSRGRDPSRCRFQRPGCYWLVRWSMEAMRESCDHRVIVSSYTYACFQWTWKTRHRQKYVIAFYGPDDIPCMSTHFE